MFYIHLITQISSIMYPVYHQILSINNEGNQEYIRTGATFNNIQYISLPVILAMYSTSDPTLRKYLKEKGSSNDSFLADGRLFVNEQFLKKNHFHLKGNNVSTYHPYKKGNITGAKLPYIISSSSMDSNPKLNVFKSSKVRNTIRQEIELELKKINWDYFITIHISSNTNQDYWDVVMMKFIDELGIHLESPNVLAAYCTEMNYDSQDERINNRTSNHRHIHILLHRDSRTLKIESIKGMFLRAMNRKRFNPKEFNLSMYDKSMWATSYILKQFNFNKDCFSMVSPSVKSLIIQ